MVSLLAIPAEVLELVVLELVLLDPIGPPSDLVALLLTCRDIYGRLSYTRNTNLYMRIFKATFDTTALRRRGGDRATLSRHLAAQLRQNWFTLQRIRDGDVHAETVFDDFWETFLMMIENDGKNAVQMAWSGLGAFVDRFVRTRLWEERENGWPVDKPINALALWLLWGTMDEESLAADPDARQSLIDLILPYIVMAFKYPAYHAPDNHFILPLPEEWEVDELISLETVHGNYPHYRPPTEDVYTRQRHGTVFQLIAPPLPAAAKLIYFGLREAIPLAIPDNLPVDRPTAIAQGLPWGPTQADLHEVNTHRSAKFIPATSWDWLASLSDEEVAIEMSGTSSRNLKAASRRWDDDWERLTNCWNPWVNPELKGPVYTFGALDGRWQGRHLIPDFTGYMNLISTQGYPPEFGETAPFMSTWPMFMALKEHHCISPRPEVLVGGDPENALDDGIHNAWLPRKLHIRQEEHSVLIRMGDNETTEYETFEEGRKNSHSEETCELCISNRMYEEEVRRAEAERGPALRHADYEAEFEAAGLGMSYGAQEEYEEELVDTYNSQCSGICDIIFTGETEPNHSMAWGRFTILGRVRTWDGLIALVRIPYDPHRPRWVFRGYLHYNTVLVGSWRGLSTDVESIPWEGPFAMSKRT